MPSEIPKDLFDAVVHNGVAVHRYSNSVVKDIIKLLNASDREIVAKIAARGEVTSFTAKRLNALLAETRAMVKDSYAVLHDTLKEEMVAYAGHAADTTGKLIGSQLPASFSPVGLTATQLAAIVSKAPISIGVDSKLLLSEVFNKLSSGHEEKIRGAIRLSMVQGEGVGEAVKRLRGTRAMGYKDGLMEISRRNAESIVRSVIVDTGNKASQAMYKQNDEVVKGWVYVATFDSKLCNFCWPNSGKRFDVGTGPIPIIHVNCRCTSAPEVKTWKELGFDAEEFGVGKRSTQTGLVKADLSFGDWLKDQPKGLQTELLGPARQKMFSMGTLKLNKFTDASGKLITLKELKGA
jgi:SPP1 gp7 family putative phage head morphogenesis protein